VGHTKGYIQVLVVAPDSMLGSSAIVRITSVGRWSVFGEVIETLTQSDAQSSPIKKPSLKGETSPFDSPCGSNSCSREADSCACEGESCGQKVPEEESIASRKDVLLEERSSRYLISWVLKKRRSQVKDRVENGIGLGNVVKQDSRWKGKEWGSVDRALLGGILLSFLTVVAVLVHLGITASARA
ncbi:hypothetical protein CRG98_022150, partial [Punica granatum]